MEMPRPREEHQKLEAFVGDWKGEETLFPSPWSPDTRSALGRFSCRMGMDGFFLVSDYEETQDGAVCYVGHGVYGFDPKEGTYTMHWFDSMGGPCGKAISGGWNGNELSFENDTPQGRSRYTHSLEEDGSYGFRIEVSQDAGATWAKFMEGRYERA